MKSAMIPYHRNQKEKGDRPALKKQREEETGCANLRSLRAKKVLGGNTTKEREIASEKKEKTLEASYQEKSRPGKANGAEGRDD